MRQSEYKKIAEILCDAASVTDICICDLCAYSEDDNCRDRCEEGISRDLKNRMNSDT